MSEQHDARGLVTVDTEAVKQSLLRAIQTAADKATMAEVVQEMDDAGKAALAFTQALILMDPTLGQGGVPTAEQHANALELEKARTAAKERAQASSPAKGLGS